MSAVDTVSLQSVTKIFRHRPALFNWLGKERTGATRAVSDVTMEAKAGEALALLGPNGSGKSTLFRLIATMLLPEEGTVLVGGHDAVLDAQAVRRKVGFAVASERSFFPRLTARENLAFFAALEDVPRKLSNERVEETLVITGMAEYGDTLVQKFSSGLYQRLGISRALLKRPSVLLLDEPTRSLDPGAASHLWEWIRASAVKHSTVLIATHNFEEACSVANSVAVLRAGKLISHRALSSSTSMQELRAFYFEQVADGNAGTRQDERRARAAADR